jgi:hypothetical protein
VNAQFGICPVNMAIRCFLPLVLSLVIAVSLHAPIAAQVGPECWQIDYSTNFAGHIKLTFCDRAIAMNLEKFGVVIISNAPKWNSVVYNELNKRYMEVSNEQWRNSQFIEKLLRRQLSKAAKMQPEFTQETKLIEGFQTTHMILKVKNSSGEMDESSELWVTPGLHVPSQFKQFLQIALGVSEQIKGTPLQISVIQKDLIDKSPHLVQALVAYKISKTANTGAFKALPGYKEVKSEINLLTEDDTR